MTSACRAVRVWTTSPEESPRTLRREATEDGASGAARAPTMPTAGSMRWDGFTWLRDGVVTLRLDVAPVTLRGLRLTLTEGGPRPVPPQCTS